MKTKYRIHQTAQHFIIKKDKRYAVPYPIAKTGWKNPHSYQNAGKSVEHASGYKREFLKPQRVWSGMQGLGQKKALVPYTPGAARSRLP